MKVLVVGGGGREHALAWKLADCPSVSEIYAAPGNPGMASVSSLVPIEAADVDGMVDFASKRAIDMVVVGPELPLSMGIADRLAGRGILCFGPGAEGARLESSKRYAREFMTRHGIPCPSWRAFSDAASAREYVESLPDAPLVVKADGLAQGKGVVVAPNRAETMAAIDWATDGRFGQAGESLLIEEKLDGEELSLLVLTDGRTMLPMLPAQDHKRIGDGDTGPNTGGMGAYSPVSIYTPQVATEVEQTIIAPLRDAFVSEKLDYRGCLYIGLMLTKDGPRVIEFNARFGDPEAQAILPLLKSDLCDLMYACASGPTGTGKKLSGMKLEWSGWHAVCVVMASGGYPLSYQQGFEITGIPQDSDSLTVFHSGTARAESGALVTAGGRVLDVTGVGATVKDALKRVYAGVESIRFEKRVFRRDIAYREISRA
ncbi:MAG: phosphoribosylamine--glycine ligase [Synergistaceae bacterium]|nr:phosphoribosylamine--glycine ligase [Synergistaceae bacterium]